MAQPWYPAVFQTSARSLLHGPKVVAATALTFNWSNLILTLHQIFKEMTLSDS